MNKVKTFALIWKVITDFIAHKLLVSNLVSSISNLLIHKYFVMGSYCVVYLISFNSISKASV